MAGLEAGLEACPQRLAHTQLFTRVLEFPSLTLAQQAFEQPGHFYSLFSETRSVYLTMTVFVLCVTQIDLILKSALLPQPPEWRVSVGLVS